MRRISIKKLKSKKFSTLTGLIVILIVISILGFNYWALYYQTSKLVNVVGRLELELEKKK